MPSPPSLLEASEVAARQGVDPECGLTAAEAADRLAQHGPNELRSVDEDPAWRRFLQQFADPLVHLLLAAVVVSGLAWVADGAEGVPVDAVAALADMTATRSTVLRDGRLIEVPAARSATGAAGAPVTAALVGAGGQPGWPKVSGSTGRSRRGSLATTSR
ncbi:cation-transporting P-type ATPase [Kytococcus sp. Marseille-QA3725]